MKIAVVLVLYNKSIDQSETFQTLQQGLPIFKELQIEVDIIIYDNSQNAQPSSDQQNFVYKHDPRNLGVVTAYNFAWQYAQEEGHDWVLLLDHDTQLTEAYFKELAAETVQPNPVVAIIPQIMSNQTIVSPVVSDTVVPLKMDRPAPGIHMTPIMGINSGCLVRRSFLDEIGGFNEAFPLDCLDFWFFSEIFRCGYGVLVLEATLVHDLSVFGEETVSFARYKSILNSEIRYYQHYQNALFKDYKIEAFKRATLQMLHEKNKKIPLYTFMRLLSVMLK